MPLTLFAKCLDYAVKFLMFWIAVNNNRPAITVDVTYLKYAYL